MANTKQKQLHVAKRGTKQNKPQKKPGDTSRNASNSENNTASTPSATAPAASAGPPQPPTHQTPKKQESNRSSSPSPRRVSSGVNPRKVSAGLKQLPPSAYQFVRESYLMLDSDGTGSVSRSTLKEMLKSIGMHEVGDSTLDQMLDRTGEPITFAGYLAVMGDLLADLPPRDEMDLMLDAFKMKDGSFDERAMEQALLSEGLSKEDIKTVMKRFSKPSRRCDVFDANAFACTMSV